MTESIHIITVVTGDLYVNFLRPFIYSVEQHQPNSHLIVYYSELSDFQLKSLRLQFPRVKFKPQNILKSERHEEKIGGKVRFFIEGLKQIQDGEKVLLLDCDLLFVKRIDWVFQNHFDICFTWKEEGFPLNTGVVALVNSLKTRLFVEEWRNKTQEILCDSAAKALATKLFGAADQMAIAELLYPQNYKETGFRVSERTAESHFDGEREIAIESHRIKVRGINCRFINETRSVSISQDTHIIHYKSGWHRILLQGYPFHSTRRESDSKEMHEYWKQTSRDCERQWANCIVSLLSDSWIERVKSLDKPKSDRGILNSEMVLVLWFIDYFGITRVVESGRWNGHSTELIAEMFKNNDVSIESIDLFRSKVSPDCERRLSIYPKVRLHYGNSVYMLPALLEKSKEPTILLIDGPKGELAVRLIKKLMEDFPNIVAAFLHDTYLGSTSRAILEKNFGCVEFTDQPEFCRRLSQLDDVNELGTIHPDKYHGRVEDTRLRGSYGPTLAMILQKNITLAKSGGVLDTIKHKLAFRIGSAEARLREIRETFL